MRPSAPLEIRDSKTFKMHAYRSHNCGALRASDTGAAVRLSGWIHRKRDHGGLIFVDLRDHYGLTQLVLHPGAPGFDLVERLRAESVIRVDGEVIARSAETVNPSLPTGEVEVRVTAVEVLSEAAELAPVLGLVGTLVALALFSGAADDTGYASAIGTAIMATLYGLIAANFLFAPLAGAIERRARAEERARQDLLEWLAGAIEQVAPKTPKAAKAPVSKAAA